MQIKRQVIKGQCDSLKALFFNYFDTNYNWFWNKAVDTHWWWLEWSAFSKVYLQDKQMDLKSSFWFLQSFHNLIKFLVFY